MARETKDQLIEEIHGSVLNLNVKNLLIKQKGTQTYIWMTLSSESTMIDSMILCHIKKVLEAIRRHAVCFCKVTQTKVADIQVSKIEITNDLKGAFFPGRFDIAFKLMWESLKQKFTVFSKKAILIFTTCVRLFAQKFSKAKKLQNFATNSKFQIVLESNS